MRVNAQTALLTSKVLLVPYSRHHVPMYHQWMQDQELQIATASEPLSLDEEYAMQQSWRTDPDKLTFIICQPPKSTPELADPRHGSNDSSEVMIGDVNLFLFDQDDETDADPETAEASRGVIGELELMIACKDFRRRGYGNAALTTFISYIRDYWEEIAGEYSKDGHIASLEYLRVKVNQSNMASIALFESIGFTRISDRANYFGEIELRCVIGAAQTYKRLYQRLEYNNDTV